MILESGTKTLVVHRRIFESDHPRFFIGTVDAYESGVARVTGHTWLVDQMGGVFFKKPDARTKVLSLVSGSLIVYQLPVDTDLEKIRFEKINGCLFLTDRRALKMDLSESEHPPTGTKRT